MPNTAVIAGNSGFQATWSSVMEYTDDEISKDEDRLDAYLKEDRNGTVSLIGA